VTAIAAITAMAVMAAMAAGDNPDVRNQALRA
jgi:hypothetical protein